MCLNSWVNFRLSLKIKLLFISTNIVFLGCKPSPPIELINIQNLNRFDLTQYEKTVKDGYNYYLLPNKSSYQVNKKGILDSELDFVKYKEYNTIHVIETEKTREKIGYAIDLISKTYAKQVLENLQAHPHKEFEISTSSINDFGYDFGQRKVRKFDRTLIWIIRKGEKTSVFQNQLRISFQKPDFSKTVSQPYYQLDFSALLCRFEIKVNDMEILTMNLDGQTSTDIPINAAIFGSGLQKIEVKGFPVDGTKIMNKEAYIRYKVIEQEVSTGKFIFVKDFEKYQTPIVEEGMPFIVHTSNFIAEVPYVLDSWSNLQNVHNLKPEIWSGLTAAYQKIIEKAKDGDFKPLVDAIKAVEIRNAKTMYLDEHDTHNRIKSILDNIADGFTIKDLPKELVLTYAANGQLVQFVGSDGRPAFVLENYKTGKELVLDFWFCLPNGSQKFIIF